MKVYNSGLFGWYFGLFLTHISWNVFNSVLFEQKSWTLFTHITWNYKISRTFKDYSGLFLHISCESIQKWTFCWYFGLFLTHISWNVFNSGLFEQTSRTLFTHITWNYKTSRPVKEYSDRWKNILDSFYTYRMKS